MITETIEKLIQKIEVFDDSYELAQALREVKTDSTGEYYCLESAESLIEMFNLLMDIKRQFNRSNHE